MRLIWHGYACAAQGARSYRECHRVCMALSPGGGPRWINGAAGAPLTQGAISPSCSTDSSPVSRKHIAAGAAAQPLAPCPALCRIFRRGPIVVARAALPGSSAALPTASLGSAAGSATAYKRLRLAAAAAS